MEKIDYLNQAICLSDIPKDRIFEDKKTGKKWIGIVAAHRREPDKYGNTYSVYMKQTKEERDAKVGRSYVGFGKDFSFNSNNPQSIESIDDMQPADNIDDLPF